MVSEKPWKADLLILLVAGLLLSWSAGQLVNLTLPRWLPSDTETDRGFLQFLISTLSFQGAALVLTHQFLRLHNMGWQDLLVVRERPVLKLIGIAIAVGLLVIPVAQVLVQYVSLELIRMVELPVEKQTAVAIIEKTAEPSKRVCFALAAVVMVPIAEEVLFRGILYQYLKPRVGPWLAVTATSILFAASHQNLLIFIPLTFFGFVLTWVYEKTDSLLTPIVTHAVFNAANLCLITYQSDLPRWLHERV